MSVVGGAITGAAAASIPIIGPPLAAAGAAFMGRVVGKEAIPEIANAGEDKVFANIEKFFGSVWKLVTGQIYQPAAKIVMKQTVDSFNSER